jgi:Flp pilus assembly protein TadG
MRERFEIAASRSLGRRRSGRSRSGRWCSGQGGSVTIEVAMVLPVLLATMLFGVWVVGVVVANIRCVDAARDVARAVARGESAAAAEEIGIRAAPTGAVVLINRDGSDVRVVVRSKVSLDWALLNGLPPIQVKGEAVMQTEPGAAGELP